MHIRTSPRSRMHILRYPARNPHAALFNQARQRSPLGPSCFTPSVSFVRAFVTSLPHLFHSIRRDPRVSLFFLRVLLGPPVYLNKSGQVDTLSTERSSFIYYRDRRLWFFVQRHHCSFTLRCTHTPPSGSHHLQSIVANSCGRRMERMNTGA
jgi:hypothetical protein